LEVKILFAGKLSRTKTKTEKVRVGIPAHPGGKKPQKIFQVAVLLKKNPRQGQKAPAAVSTLPTLPTRPTPATLPGGFSARAFSPAALNFLPPPSRYQGTAGKP
jgi:hypothetical protein